MHVIQEIVSIGIKNDLEKTTSDFSFFSKMNLAFSVSPNAILVYRSLHRYIGHLVARVPSERVGVSPLCAHVRLTRIQIHDDGRNFRGWHCLFVYW